MSKLLSNTTGLQEVLEALQNKAAGSGDSSAGYAEADALIAGNLSTYTNDRVTTIGQGAFAYCLPLTSVDFPKCTNIGNSAFAYCSKLTSVNFPVCSYIGNSAFAYCSKLTSVNFPVCSCIGSNAFGYCSSLTSASFPVCISIDKYAFAYCSKLTSVNFPVCSRIGSNAFGYCSSLTSVNFPICSYIGGNAFGYCSSLTSASFPVCSYIGNSAFYYCLSLTSVNFPVCSRIGSYTFQYCTNLSTLILGLSSSICTLSNSNAFTLTPYAGYSASFSGQPWIYVPSSLLTSYQTATNWTFFSSYFSSIESLNGPSLITFTIDGTEYQAEEGMTWAEWCDSEYCNNLWSVAIGDDYEYNYIVNAPGALEINGTSSFDIIEPGYNYTTKVHGNF